MIDYILEYKELIGVLAGVGTFIYAIIALYTLVEVKKQRLSMYKPELFLKSFCIIPTFNPLSVIKRDKSLEYKLVNYNDYSENTAEETPRISVLYKLENMGFGVAKDIKCVWEFDYKKAINKILPHISSEYEMYSHKLFYGIRKLNDEKFHRSASPNLDEQNIDYISPINQSTHNHKHTIPEIILFTHTFYFIFKNDFTTSSHDNYFNEDFDNFPKPKLHLSYKDINGKKYKKTYVINITCCSATTKETLTMEDELCIFYCLCEESN